MNVIEGSFLQFVALNQCLYLMLSLIRQILYPTSIPTFLCSIQLSYLRHI